jgi:hypothetical protein
VPLGISPVPSGIDTGTDPGLVQNAAGLWLSNDGKGASNLVVMSESTSGPQAYAPLVAILESGVGADGTLQLNADGSFAFTPAPGFVGQATFTYHVFDGANTSASPATVTIDVQPASPTAQYADWLLQFPGLGTQTNLMDDFEPDGVVNLLEYALGGNPVSNDVDGILPGSGLAMDGGSNWLNYVYDRRSDATARGLTYAVLSGNDLPGGDVTTDVPLFSVASATNGFETAIHRISTDAATNAFMKLDVEMIK